MLFEMREYVAAPGAADRLHRRFADHTLALFERHGLEVVGFWTDRDDPGRIVYVLRFPDAEARDRAWAAFGADPQWKQVKAESERDGPVVSEMHSRLLSPTDYWPT